MALPHDVMMRGLVVARYLYESGVQQSHQRGFRRATALLTLHDAVEMLLVLGLQHHDLYNRRKLYAFDQYWTELATKDVHVTQQGAMQRLNNARVNLKHHASLPGPDVVEEARVQAGVFFIENTPIIFGLNFDDVSLSSIVMYDKPRTHLEQADRHMSAGEYEAAIREIACAFHHLAGQRRSEGDPWALSRLRSELSSLPLPGDAPAQMTIRQIIGAITKTIEQDQNTVRFITLGLTLGLDFGRWGRFRGLTPKISERMSGELLVERRHGVPPTLDQCRFCYDFVIDSALRLQEQQDAGM
jgi:hypothetical protein